MEYPDFSVIELGGGDLEVLFLEKVGEDLLKVIQKEIEVYSREVLTTRTLYSMNSTIKNKLHYLVMSGKLRYNLFDKSWVLEA
jgi:hypothetical protein